MIADRYFVRIAAQAFNDLPGSAKGSLTIDPHSFWNKLSKSGLRYHFLLAAAHSSPERLCSRPLWGTDIYCIRRSCIHSKQKSHLLLINLICIRRRCHYLQSHDLFTLKLAVMKRYLLLILMLLPAFSWAQQWAKQFDYVDDIHCGLSLVGKGDKKGFVNQKGDLVVPLVYEDAMGFCEGLAAVRKAGKWGFVDSTGKESISFEYEEAFGFCDGLALVIKNRQHGFINKNGKVVIPLHYQNASSFSEGLAAVNLNGKWGYIDTKGQQVIPCKYGYAMSFSEGHARVSKNGKWWNIDKNGKEFPAD